MLPSQRAIQKAVPYRVGFSPFLILAGSDAAMP
jgi:hypothetical protein